jgi:hypothetical protein
VIYVYGFLAAPAELPQLSGLAGAPVEPLELAGMTLALSRLEGGAPEATEESVLCHARVVEELTRTADAVLPARFGLVFSDEAGLRRAVDEHAGELRRGLERVRGCVELGLRVLAPEPVEEPVAAGGGEYLRARLRETTERDRLACEVDDALVGLARHHVLRSPPSGEVLLTAAYLVPEGSVEQFRRALRKLEWSHPQLDLICTGPWPPYSFAANPAPTLAEAR